MDERRFRLIMKRVFYAKKSDFEEEEDFIEVDDGSIFPKKLAQVLLPLTNEYLNLSEIWNDSGKAWIVAGFIHEYRFEIRIAQNEDGNPILFIEHIYDEEERLSEEIREIAVRFRDWYEECFAWEVLLYSANAMLYFPEKIPERWEMQKIQDDDFSPAISRELKKHGYQTIGDLLQKTEEELEKDFGYSTFLELVSFRRMVNKWMKNPVYHVFSIRKPTLREKYPIVFDIPLCETELDEDIVYLLEREGHRTIEDVMKIPKDVFPLLYIDIDEGEVKEIESMLKPFGLKLTPKDTK